MNSSAASSTPCATERTRRRRGIRAVAIALTSMACLLVGAPISPAGAATVSATGVEHPDSGIAGCC